ncbi:MAG: DUF6167 family protein [Propionibacteriaceae bacterium]
MLRRAVWFTVGAGVGVFVVLKARNYLRRATPAAVQERLGQAAVGMGGRVVSFLDEARAAMAERETELRDTPGLTKALGLHDQPGSGPRRAADGAPAR